RAARGCGDPPAARRGNTTPPPRRRADHPRAERRDSCPKAKSEKGYRATAPARERRAFPAKLWRLQPVRPQPHAARLAKRSRLVDSTLRPTGPPPAPV